MLEKIMNNKSIFKLSLLILTATFLTQTISSELSLAQTPIEKTGPENNQSNNTILVCELVQFCTNPKEVQPNTIIHPENNETKLIKPSEILPENTDASNISTIPENTDALDISTIPDVTSNISLIITPDIIDPLVDENTQLPNTTTTEDLQDKVLTTKNLNNNSNNSEVMKVITPSNTSPINSTNNATTISNTSPINSTNNATTISNTSPIKENQTTNTTSQEINSTNVNNQTANPDSNKANQQTASPFPLVDQIFGFFGIK
jgi:hypothetical protein